MTGSMELQPDNGPRLSISIGPGSNDAVGSRQEFAWRFAEEIRKLTGNMKGDHREKTGGLIVRMPEATGLAKVGSKLSLWSLSVVIKSEEAIDAKLEAFENCMEEKMRSLFTEFSIGRPSSPRKSHHGQTSDQRDDPQEHGYITSDPNNPSMKVDFPIWEEGDSIGWISCVERYFRFYRTADATWVKIAAIHLEEDAIQWFN
ncbi:hypothetical protein BHE74_00054916 [Ensete ventricosum]|nr:hypothetical protein BHE74_00054916 [Ensete ventricosum]